MRCITLRSQLFGCLLLASNQRAVVLAFRGTHKHTITESIFAKISRTANFQHALWTGNRKYMWFHFHVCLKVAEQNHDSCELCAKLWMWSAIKGSMGVCGAHFFHINMTIIVGHWTRFQKRQPFPLSCSGIRGMKNAFVFSSMLNVLCEQSDCDSRTSSLELMPLCRMHGATWCDCYGWHDQKSL